MKIQDYLHFYLGCEVEMISDGYTFPHPVVLGISLLNDYLTTFMLPGGVLIKPILRPLDSMTDDECEKYGVDSDGGEYYYGSISSDCTVGGYHHVLSINRISEIVRELCKDGFDCFELIDAGLAIDATKLTTPVK